jgi:ketosteroid isomerase-like protein
VSLTRSARRPTLRWSSSTRVRSGVSAFARDTARAVSQENVEIVRQAFELKVRGRGGDAELAAFHPDVVITSVEEGPSHGLSAIRDNFERWASVWDRLDTTAEEFVDAGDRVLVTARHRARGRGSGVEVDAYFHEVYTLRDGKIIRVDEFSERREALEAAGLST